MSKAFTTLASGISIGSSRSKAKSMCRRLSVLCLASVLASAPIAFGSDAAQPKASLGVDGIRESVATAEVLEAALRAEGFLSLAQLGLSSKSSREGRSILFKRILVGAKTTSDHEAAVAGGAASGGATAGVGGGRTERGYRFLVLAGVHGNERLPPQFVLWLAARLERGEGPLSRLPREGGVATTFDLVPLVNPDGFRAGTRENAAGVDLNRNYSKFWDSRSLNPGDRPFSEPETAAVRGMLRVGQYTAAFDLHGYANGIVSPSPDGGHPETAGVYAKWSAVGKDLLKLLPGGDQTTGRKLGHLGAFEDYSFWEEKTLAFCLEFSSERRMVPADDDSFASLMEEMNGFLGSKDSGRPKKPADVDTYLQYERILYQSASAAIEITNQKNTAGAGSKDENDGVRKGRDAGANFNYGISSGKEPPTSTMPAVTH